MSASYNEMAGRLMVALDYPDAQRAKALVRLEGIPCYMKVGMHCSTRPVQILSRN